MQDAPTLKAGRVLAAMSGGVDSAVAAWLGSQELPDAVGVTMRLWSPGAGELSDKVRQCCGPTAYEDARCAAAAIGIPHYVVNFEAAFQRAVVDYFCSEYLAGRTPNPCVACNNLVKFGALLDFAKALGAGVIVTGHYARIRHDAQGPHLMRAADKSKDQSYMLAGLRREQLAAMRLPLGTVTKEQTRQTARQLGLGVAEKPDSMDLCFVDGDYRRFIRDRFPDCTTAGPVLTTSGRFVGTHDGLLNFTVGQRKGIPAAGLGDGPWYVVRTERDTNAVVVGRREELARRALTCSHANLLRAERFLGAQAVAGLAVCRYRSKAVRATAVATQGGELQVHLEQPVPIASPGQLLVLYDTNDDEVLASGVIAA